MRSWILGGAALLSVFGACASAPGAEDTLASSAARIYDGDVPGDQLGRSVVVIGDVDDDGLADYAISSRGNDPVETNAGRIVVHSGVDGSVIATLDGEGTSNQFGEALAPAGDVDDDGRADLIVGAWANSAGGSTAGRAYVYSAAQGAPLYTFTGLSSGDTLGDSVNGAGDVDNDGHDDVIVGAPTRDIGASNTGQVTVFSGADGSVIWTVNGENENDRLGVSVAGVGDINGDGYADFGAGAHLFDDGGGITDNRGRVYIYSGKTGALLYHVTGEGAGDNFGWDIAPAGDVNNDGDADFVVGAPLNDALGSNTGRVYVYSGPTGALLHTFTGEAAVDKLGLSVGPAGDVDSDGFADILTGAWWNDAGTGASGDNRGRAYIFSGRTGALLHSFTGEASLDHLGRPVSGGHDINADGTPDLLVGARDSDANGPDAGRAYVFFLPATCPADLADPEGVLDFSDVVSFLVAFGAGESDADLANPIGVHDFSDVVAFLTAFASACQ